MLSFRSPLTLGALPLGAVVGALTWLTLARGATFDARLADLSERFAAMRSPAGGPSYMPTDLGQPLFALTTGPGAVTEPTVQLQGLARSPARTAALLAINGKPAEWLELGQSRDGVTLQEVAGDHVLVDMVTGVKPLALGATVGPDPNAAAASAPPPGVRRPSPPASAPTRP